ncbi:MAG: asparaginyl/glutamyl-tRNA amidotransferase subunit C [Gammaproteobacteria bacterium RIFCSPHIGHO2_12_FULL_41_20]|nr:MAG: asparaginyl/glutamyl-tRNA amidotransferase subunit C [Gammaproteobacteria bacterium RIFCSPHIGHO2_12_FULL_41_20]
MSLTLDDVKKIAYLARLNLSTEESTAYATQLSNILEFAAQMDKVDTATVEPLAHPLDLSQRLRPDQVTETNQREKFQAIAPKVKAGLYLVPKVIEDA